MGIEIRYLVPAAAGSAFAYAVERREDGACFDFEQDVYRPLDDIPADAITRPLIYQQHDRAMVAHFEQVEDGQAYIVRIYRSGQGNKLIAALPVITQSGDGDVSTSKGGPQMEPSYRAGKKFIGNRAIDARYRLTFHGNDGFTIHTATLWEDGTSSCNCPQWGPKVDGKRQCRHSLRALTLTANVDETGEQSGPPSPKAPRGTNPFKRRSRPVDT